MKFEKKPEIVTMTRDEWKAKGTKLFGPDMMKWRFVCPACGNITAVEDYRKYTSQGATPDSAYCNCIGRYDGHMNVSMGAGKPCNYAGNGLFDLRPVRVMDGEKEIGSFAFDENSKGVE